MDTWSNHKAPSTLSNYLWEAERQLQQGNVSRVTLEIIQKSWPKDSLPISSGREKGKFLRGSAWLTVYRVERAPSYCQAWREMSVHGRLQHPTSRDSQKVIHYLFSILSEKKYRTLNYGFFQCLEYVLLLLFLCFVLTFWTVNFHFPVPYPHL